MTALYTSCGAQVSLGGSSGRMRNWQIKRLYVVPGKGKQHHHHQLRHHPRQHLRTSISIINIIINGAKSSPLLGHFASVAVRPSAINPSVSKSLKHSLMHSFIHSYPLYCSGRGSVCTLLCGAPLHTLIICKCVCAGVKDAQNVFRFVHIPLSLKSYKTYTCINLQIFC